jgi:hypothetical protein
MRVVRFVPPECPAKGQPSKRLNAWYPVGDEVCSPDRRKVGKEPANVARFM